MFKIICAIIGIGLIVFGGMGIYEGGFNPNDVREIVVNTGSIILGGLIGLISLS